MKKNITVNISGVIFHIDEDAYDLLGGYLDKLSKHFKQTEGGAEIISDIEGRIAEMLGERGKDEKPKIVTIEDIEEVITLLGDPVEISDNEEKTDTGSDEQSYGSRPRRFFRDPDEKVLGGIAGGMGAYFNTDPLWFRILFIVLVFVGGLGIPLYIILWLITPKARTVADRLEMRGEPVNISNIERSIKEEMEEIKDRFKGWKEGSGQKKKEVRESSSERFGRFLLNVALYFTHFIAWIVGLALIVIGVGILLTLLIPGLGLHHFHFTPGVPLHRFFFFITGSDSDAFVLVMAICLVIGIPVLTMIYGGIKLLFQIKRRVRPLGIVSFLLWIISIATIVFYALNISAGLAYSASLYSNDTFPDYNDKAYIIKLSEQMTGDGPEIIMHNYHYNTVDSVKIFYGIPLFEFVQNAVDTNEVVVYAYARGASHGEAYKNAKTIDYDFFRSDTMISFDQWFFCADQPVFKDQQIKVQIKVSEGQPFIIDDSFGLISHRIVNFDDDCHMAMIGKPLVMRNKKIEYFPNIP